MCMTPVCITSALCTFTQCELCDTHTSSDLSGLDNTCYFSLLPLMPVYGVLLDTVGQNELGVCWND